MGEVFLVEDMLQGERERALKTIKQSLIRKDVLDNFKKEFDVMTRLKHPNLAQVYDFGCDREKGIYFITMEYLGDLSLQDLLTQEGTLSEEKALDHIVIIARAIAFIHTRNILHRDIKPDNVMIINNEKLIMKNETESNSSENEEFVTERNSSENEEFVTERNSSLFINHYSLKVMDFGLADLEENVGRRTKGTLKYMAPEILKGNIDHRVDLYALGLTFYEMLVGDFTFFPSHDSHSIIKLLKEQKEFIRNREHALNKVKNPQLRTIIEKLLSFQPEDRYQSASEVILAINQHLHKSYELETPETQEAYVLGASFVDRVRELNRLTQSVSESEPQRLMLVTGEKGIGKTRLLEEFKKYCQLHDMVYLQGDCPEKVSRAYSPFLDILNQALLEVSERLVETYGSELKKILPQHQRFASIQANEAYDPKTERGVLVENITNFLLEFVSEQQIKTVLYLNDWQWTDDASADVVNELLFKLNQPENEDIELRIYATARTEAMDAMESDLTYLREKNRLQEVRLSPFTADDVDSYINAIFGENYVDSSLRKSIPDLLEAVGGVPLDLQETIKSLVENHIITRNKNLKRLKPRKVEPKAAQMPTDLQQVLQDAKRIDVNTSALRWELATPVSQVDLQLSSGEIIQARLDRMNLNSDQKRCLQLLSLLHDSISIAAFQKFVDGDYDVNIAQLFSILERKEFLKSEKVDDKIEYGFRQALIQEVVHRSIENPEELHLYLAETLEERYQDNIEEYVEEIAYNYERTSKQEKAIEYLEKAGDKAKADYANHKAIEFYDKVLERLADSEPAKRIDLLFKKGQLFGLIGNWQKEKDLSEEALSFSEKIEEKALIAKSKKKLGYVLLKKAEFQSALPYFEDALKLYEELDDGDGARDSLLHIGSVYLRQGDFDRAMDYFQRNLERCEDAGDELHKRKILDNLGVIYFYRRDVAKAKEVWERNLENVKQSGDKKALQHALGRMGVIYGDQEDSEKALEYFKKTLRIAEELGDKGDISNTIANIGTVYLLRGDYSEAIKCYERQLRLAEEMGDTHNIGIVLSNKSEAYFKLGKYKEAEEDIDHSIRIMRELGDKYHIIPDLYRKALILFKREDYAEADTYNQEALRLSEEVDRTDVLNSIKMLSLKIKYYREDEKQDREAAISEFKTMLSDIENKSKKAQINYELYEITDEDSYLEKSLEIYQLLNNKHPRIKYRKKIEEIMQLMREKYINNRYKIIRKVGEGGMGEVFRVEDILQGKREVALKTIRSELIRADILESFRREFEVMTRLKHPNLARVYDFGFDRQRNIYYLTMEYAGDTTLNDLLRRDGKFSKEDALEFMVKLCRTIEFIHTRKVLHRDIKPSNIMVTDGTLKVMDFGLSDLGSENIHRTKGTLKYMAPETIGGKIDERVDIYAAGITFYEMVTGEFFFYPSKKSNTIIRILKHQSEFIENKKIALHNIEDPAFREIIGKMIEYDPNQRYRFFSEIIQDINKKFGKDYPFETINTAEAYVLGAGFVGRREELAKIQNSISNGKEHDSLGKLLLVSGEARIGKSRLFEEVKKYCQLHDYLFFQGDCYQLIAKTYFAFSDILNEALFDASEKLIQNYGPELKKILPKHKSLMGIEANPQLDPKEERSIIVENVTSFLIDYVNEIQTKTVLYINSLHLADEGSLEILDELMYKLTQNQEGYLRVFASVREQERANIKPTLDRLAKKGRLMEMTLTPFDSDDVEEYIHAVFGEDFIDPSLRKEVHAIQERVGGNPFFLRELIKSVIDRGIIVKNVTQWQLIKSIEAAEVPDNLTEIVRKRVGSLELSGDEMEALQIFALITSGVTIELFKKLIKSNGKMDIVGLFEELERKEIVSSEEVEDKIEYKFSQSVIREIFEEKIENAAEIHNFIAQRLEEIHKDELEDVIEELAHHYRRTHNVQKAKYYLKKAGDKAKSLYDNEKALDYYESLIELYTDEKEQRINILLKEGEILDLIGKWDEAIRVYEQSLDLAKEMENAKLQADSSVGLGKILRGKGKLEEAENLFDSALEIYDDLGDEKGNAAAYAAKGYLMLTQSRHDVAFECYQNQLKIGDTLDDKSEIGNALGYMGMIYRNEGEYDKAKEYLERRLEIARELKDKKALSETYNHLALIYSDQEEQEQAMAYYQKYFEFSRQLGDKRGISLALNNMATIYNHRGQHKQAMENYQKLLEISQEMGNKRAISIAYGNMGIVYSNLGKLDKAMEHYKKKLKLAEELKDKRGMSIALGNIGSVYHMKKEYKKALEFAQRRTEISEEINEKVGICIGYGGMGNAYKGLNQYSKALEAYGKSIELGKELNLRYYLMAFIHEKADTLYLLEEYDRAREFVKEARKVAEDVGNQEMVFSNRVLSAKIKFYSADEKKERDKAITKLKKMLAAEKEEEHLAKLNLTLYRLLDDKDYGRTAFNYYSQLYQKTGNIKYQNEIDQLKEELEKTEDISKYFEKEDLFEFYLNQLSDHITLIREKVKHGEKPEGLGFPGVHSDKVRYYRELLEITRELNSNLKLEELLVKIVDLSIDFIHSDRGFILLYNDEGNLETKVARNSLHEHLSTDQYRISHKVLEKVIESGKPVFLSEISEYEEFATAESILDLKLRSVMCIPLGRRYYEGPFAEKRRNIAPTSNQILGILYLDSGERTEKSRFRGENLEFLEALADQASVALINTQLYERRNIDALTGLFLRPFFEECLESEISFSREIGSNLSMAVIEIASVKKNNDEQKQPVSDAILKRASEELQNILRSSDICARFTGNRFSVLFPNTDPSQTGTVLKKIKQSLEGESANGDTMTIWVGASCYPEHVNTEHDLEFQKNNLIARAEKALAYAKNINSSKGIIWNETIEEKVKERNLVNDILTGDPIKDYRNVEMLLDAIKAAESTLTLERLLVKIMDMILEVTGAERGIIMLSEDEELTAYTARTRAGKDIPLENLDFSRTIPNRVLQTGIPICLKDVSDGFVSTASVMDLELRSVMCIPLQAREKRFGVVYVDSRSTLKEFTNSDLAFFHALTSQVAGAIENARLYEESLEKERMRKELEVASNIQLSLLPKKIPEVKGLELGGRMKTALEVGGDYYDIIRSGDGRKVYLVIGDVSGKGVPAGLFMVQARTIIHALAARSLSPKEIITKTNRQIYRDMFDAENPMFITMVILCWDVETQELTYTGAGHEDILIYRGAKAACESVKTGGVFIGVMNNVDDVFQEKTLNLNSGDMILLYTDGVTDFRNPANELFGKERLTDFMAEKGELIPEKFIDRLYGELEYFGKGTAQYDDVTVIVLKKK